MLEWWYPWIRSRQTWRDLESNLQRKEITIFIRLHFQEQVSELAFAFKVNAFALQKTQSLLRSTILKASASIFYIFSRIFWRMHVWSHCSVYFLFVAGSPLIVYISISLRNILDIDELRQVILLQCHHHITTSQH